MWVPSGVFFPRNDNIHKRNNCDYNLFFSVRSVMHKHLTKMGEVTFDKIFGQKLGECEVILRDTEVL